MTLDIKAREERILSKPPRIAPLKQDEYGPDAKEAAANLAKAVGSEPGGDVEEFVGTMFRHPSLFLAHLGLAFKLFDGAIPVRERELAILRNAWLMGAPFEWGEHVSLGKRLGGLTTEEIKRVRNGSSDPGWSARDRAVLKAVEEFHTDAILSDETWDALAREFDDKQLMELPILIGQYKGIAYLQNTIRTRLRPGNAGLSAE